MPQTCPGCQGARVTTHTTVEVELDENGNQRPVTREYTATCTTCGGQGQVS